MISHQIRLYIVFTEGQDKRAVEQNIKVCSKKDANKCRTQGESELCDN